jgi:hypothetical protein
MNTKRIRAYLIVCSLVVVLRPLQGLTQQNSDPSKNSVQNTPMERDGQHDFDPLIGAWKYHLKRRLHPLTGSTTWVEFDGTGVCFKVWDGRANLDTIEVDGPTGHIEGLTLRTYNPQSHRWSLYWANSKDGTVVPPQVGQFKDGRGEFYAQDTLNGKSIFVRFVWTNMTTNTPHMATPRSCQRRSQGTTGALRSTTSSTRIPVVGMKMRSVLRMSLSAAIGWI